MLRSAIFEALYLFICSNIRLLHTTLSVLLQISKGIWIDICH